VARCGCGESVQCRQSNNAGVADCSPIPGDVEQICIILSCDLYVFSIKIFLSHSNLRARYLVMYKGEEKLGKNGGFGMKLTQSK
jgi:hypothetical protein